MRHPLNWLLRCVASSAERLVILGDLEEEYRERVRPSHNWLAAQIWYLRELLLAVGHGLRDRARGTVRNTSSHPASTARGRRSFLLADVRYALRRWRRRRGFVATAVLTLALGIGATTAIFSVVDAVLLAPAPWPEADRLVAVHGVLPERRENPTTAHDWDQQPLTWPGWANLRDLSELELVASYTPYQRSFGPDRDDVVDAMYVSSSFLPLLGVTPAMGRFFSPDEDEVAPDIIVISHEAWQGRLGGRADVLGQSVDVSWASEISSNAKLVYTIVGVLPPAFEFEGEGPQFLFPSGLIPPAWRQYGSRSFRTIARLAPDVSLEAAEAAVAPLAVGLEPPDEQSSRLESFAGRHTLRATRPLGLLLSGAGLLLLLSCLNVAGLLLGDARMRRHEVAVRAALGGSRLRMLRQLVVEHVLLAGMAAGVGILLAGWLTPLFIAIAPEQLPRLDEVAVDVRIAALALSLGVITVLVFGIVPSARLAATPAAAVLAEGGRDGAGASRHLGQRIMVAVQLGLAFMLVVGAALLGETMYRLTDQPVGFDPSNLVVVNTHVTELPMPPLPVEFQPRTPRPGTPRGSTVAAREWYMEAVAGAQTAHTMRIVARLVALPGVVSAAGVRVAPFAGTIPEAEIEVETATGPLGVPVRRQWVTGPYFETMGIQLLAGTGFEVADGDEPVAIVSAELDRRTFDGNAVGRHLVDPFFGPGPPYRVIGVVPDLRSIELGEPDAPTIYVRQRGGARTRQYVVRLAPALGPATMLPAIRQAIRDEHPQTVVTSTTMMEDRLGGLIAQQRFRASLSTVFGGAALLLAVVGLYGLATRRVADRRRELGVRVALGAAPGDVRWLVLRDGVAMVVVGLVLGLPAAFAASHVLASYLYGVEPTTPRVFALAAIVLSVAAVSATLLPARRASHIDPVLALKD